MVGQNRVHVIGQCVGGDDIMTKDATIKNLRMRIIRDFNNGILSESVPSYLDADFNQSKIVSDKIITCLKANIDLWEQIMTTYKLDNTGHNKKAVDDTNALIAKLQNLHLTKAQKQQMIDDELNAAIAALKAKAKAQKESL
jgi:hypothetical protein